ncbi:DNA polymerase III subunit gamma/tau [uncultured Thiothrix sp.]|uniref:DNA polymerase III subunit gamma/tau n=1 Tax=uncultured Thiothrix sp. TaxID=223185 RepID=UPI002635A2B7|nr:DNA polymerase III subunit gamma/tau [uncultured Thiothrix sp.]
MSYQVLARKWRPQNFQQMVGQTHVLRALLTALEANRLHHAYLFTGTRGVGKTTIARIFAKCLNCQVGVSATPCGVCNSCIEIAEGRHVDLLEVDAASRTKVEDTRDLLDNVQYAPTRGRYKIYLIDEVHMLSGHSFNALLKTLEEPPPHVKFLLATTDPQKLPVTVLSRCLQFNLKRMPLEMISSHLAHVLTEEQIAFTPSSLKILAKAADGSMRDALSLTDQAIVSGGGQISDTSVQDMLGLLPSEHLHKLLEALATNDAVALLAAIEQMAQVTTDFNTATDSLIALLHQLAVAQLVPQSIENPAELPTDLFSSADLQLFYQMALYGKRDLPLNPDPRMGFEMMLLRMLAFRLDDGKTSPTAKKKLISSAPESQSNIQQATVPVSLSVEVPKAIPEPKVPVHTPSVSLVVPSVTPSLKSEPKASDNDTLLRVIELAQPESQAIPNDWHTLLPGLSLTGMAQQLAEHCLIKEIEGNQVRLWLDSSASNLQTSRAEEQIAVALATALGQEINLSLELVPELADTPEKRRLRVTQERQAEAEQAIEQDPIVMQLKERFGASIVTGSIRPHTPEQK